MYQKENTSCKKCRGLLFDFVSDNTNQTQSQWVKEHLEHCPSCHEEYDEICLMLSVLHEEPEAELPSGFQLSLHRKLVEAAQEMECKKASSWLRRLKDMPGMRRVAPALVCLVLVIGVFSSGLFADWQNADSILVDEPNQALVNTQPPIETPMPILEQAEATKAVTPKQVTSKPVKDETQMKQEPAKTEEPVVVESVQEEMQIAVAAETTEGVGGSGRAFVIAEDVVEEIGTSYILNVPQTITAFFDAAKRATFIDWTSKAADRDDVFVVLCLSESEWEILSSYIQSLDLVPTMISQGDADREIRVTIQGVEE